MISVLMIALALNGGLYLGTILHSAWTVAGRHDTQGNGAGIATLFRSSCR